MPELFTVLNSCSNRAFYKRRMLLLFHKDTDLHVASFTTGPQDHRKVRKYEKALMSANMVTLNNSEHLNTVSVTYMYNIEYVPAVM